MFDDQCLNPFVASEFSGFEDWYDKAYTKVKQIAPAENGLLCNEMYFHLYLTWTNFVVRFIIPTIILIFCNLKILLEVK